MKVIGMFIVTFVVVTGSVILFLHESKAVAQGAPKAEETFAPGARDSIQAMCPEINGYDYLETALRKIVKCMERREGEARKGIAR